MGDETTVLSAADARQLLRRTGFGAPQTLLAHYTGLTRGAAADRLLTFPKSIYKPLGPYIENRHNSWVKYMLTTRFPLQEKLVIFWHDHFACSNEKVDNPSLVSTQNALLRKNCKGNFKTLVKAVNTDAAMQEFLDTVRNTNEQPNENYARELQELFTLGRHDLNGVPNYEQDDIVQIARAFTGWNYVYRTGKAYFDSSVHDLTVDYPQRGAKTIYASHGGFGAGGISFAPTQDAEGKGEIDAVTDIIFQHRDSDNQNTVARFITSKLLTYFAQPGVKRELNPALIPVVDAVVAASGFATTWDIKALLRAIFVHDAMYDTEAAAPYSASTKKSVKWPIDYVVTTLRLLGVKPKGPTGYIYIDGGSYSSLRDQLTNMGQTLFEPPSVFGWNWESAWISSATLLARYGFARDVTAARGVGPYEFHPEKLVNLNLTDPNQILSTATDVLGITDQLTAAEKSILFAYLTDNGANAALNLHDYDTRNIKLNGLFALLLQTPAYQLH